MSPLLCIIIFFVISVNSECNANVMNLKRLSDITNNINIPIQYTNVFNSEATEAVLSMLELNYYGLTNNFYNLSRSYVNDLDLSCNRIDASCVLNNLMNEKMYSEYEYINAHKTNGLASLFGLDYEVPLDVFETFRYDNSNNNGITVNYMRYYLRDNVFISYVDSSMLNSDGLNDVFLHSNASTNFTAIPVVVVGIYHDSNNNTYLKINSIKGYEWGCSGYNYVKITDSNNAIIYNNIGLLDEIIMAFVSDKYEVNELYTINENAYDNIRIYFFVSIGIYSSVLGCICGATCQNVHMKYQRKKYEELKKQKNKPNDPPVNESKIEENVQNNKYIPVVDMQEVQEMQEMQEMQEIQNTHTMHQLKRDISLTHIEIIPEEINTTIA
jgi:hypothetical protein